MDANECDVWAHAIHAIRGDWPAASLRTWAIKNLADWPVLRAHLAGTWVALDPTTRSPARMLEQGPWSSLDLPRDQPDTTPQPPRYQPERIPVAPPDIARTYIAKIKQRRIA